MPLRRRKNEQRDPFSHLEGERNDAETGDPWYLTETTGELEVQAGISSNLRTDDLDVPARPEHPEVPDPPPLAGPLPIPDPPPVPPPPPPPIPDPPRLTDD